MTNPMLDVAAWDDATPDPTLLVVDGAYIAIKVRDNELEITDGPVRDKRVRTLKLHKEPVKTLIVLGNIGVITLEAERWLANQGVSWVRIDDRPRKINDKWVRDRRVLNQSYGASDAKLARAQVACGEGMPWHDTGLAINRRFIQEKIEGQAWNAENLFDNPVAAKAIRECIDMLPWQHTIDTIMSVEGLAANLYWQVWRDYPMTWEGNRPLKALWQKMGKRSTEAREYDTNKDATDPVNAMLNYAYYIAEAEAVIACLGNKLDPRFSISHSVRSGRDSFALDVMEVLRPWADQVVFDILCQPMRKAWFKETTVQASGKSKAGIVRCVAPLTHRIATGVHEQRNKMTAAVKYAVAELQACTVA
jgi:CRISPR-associated endonuclease Cas1